MEMGVKEAVELYFKRDAEAAELRSALHSLVRAIEAAGLLNLSNGVQLGATSWYVKASDAMEAAKAALGEPVT